MKQQPNTEKKKLTNKEIKKEIEEVMKGMRI
jgi:hypothetical protein